MVRRGEMVDIVLLWLVMVLWLTGLDAKKGFYG
jgi:hypothetical protein